MEKHVVCLVVRIFSICEDFPERQGRDTQQGTRTARLGGGGGFELAVGNPGIPESLILTVYMWCTCLFHDVPYH